MPIYEYICRQCQHEQELLVRGDETPECESCGSTNLQKLLSVTAVHGQSTPDSCQGPLPPSGSCGPGCCCHPH